MNEYTVHTPQSDALSRAHTHTQSRWHADHTHTQLCSYISNRTASCKITLSHRMTLPRKTDIFFPLKHPIGHLIFIPKWPFLPTGVLACSNQIQPHKDKQPHVIYFYQQGMILFTVGRKLSSYRLYMFFLFCFATPLIYNVCGEICPYYEMNYCSFKKIAKGKMAH